MLHSLGFLTKMSDDIVVWTLLLRKLCGNFRTSVSRMTHTNVKNRRDIRISIFFRKNPADMVTGKPEFFSRLPAKGCDRESRPWRSVNQPWLVWSSVSTGDAMFSNSFFNGFHKFVRRRNENAVMVDKFLEFLSGRTAKQGFRFTTKI